MKIKVDRTNTSEGNLVFTITVSEPHHACFGEVEQKIMGLLELCKYEVNQLQAEGNKAQIDVVGFIHHAKELTFSRVLENLKFAIKNEFEPRFKHICQEIYNWLQDQQKDELKNWMTEFDPQRTKFYFDNDGRNNMCRDPHAISDDKIEDDVEEDEDDDDA